MRVLLDTHIFLYLALDPELLSRDVSALLQEPETLPCISAESVRELIVAYRNKGLCSKRWKTVEDMVAAIEEEFYIRILPVTKEHMATYARMEINEAQGHKDPSDHVISPTPSRNGCRSCRATRASPSTAHKASTWCSTGNSIAPTFPPPRRRVKTARRPGRTSRRTRIRFSAIFAPEPAHKDHGQRERREETERG